MEWKLGIGQTKSLFRNGYRNARKFKEHSAWLDDGHIEFNRTFTLAHTNLLRLLGHRLMREDTNPKLSFSFKVT